MVDVNTCLNYEREVASIPSISAKGNKNTALDKEEKPTTIHDGVIIIVEIDVEYVVVPDGAINIKETYFENFVSPPRSC